MRYIYKENPLATVVVLDDNEKQILWQKIKTNLLEELIFEIHFALNNNVIDIQTAKENSDINYLLRKDQNGKTKIDTETDELFQVYLSSLSFEHCGDCTCIPASCLKCSAEEILGINTLEKYSKTYGSKISSIFEKVRTIDQAIKQLSLEPERNENFENISDEKWIVIKKDLIEKNQKTIEYLKEYKKDKL